MINGNHHQIVLLTNEKVESSDNEQMRDEEERKVSTNGATDEELTSLTWLHDKNLLKGSFCENMNNIEYFHKY